MSSAVANALADDRPFGSYAYLAARLDDVQVDLLRMLADANSPADLLLQWLTRLDASARHRVLRDSLLRRTIEDGVCRVAQGVDAISPAILDDLLANARSHDAGLGETVLTGTGQCQTVWPGECPVHMWTGSGASSVAATRFVDEVLKRLPGLVLDAPDHAQIEQVEDAIGLAFEIVPSLADSAMRHVFMVVYGAFPDRTLYNSMTIPGMPGVVFINPHAVVSTMSLAHSLLHEAMHLKFMDIEYVHPLFIEGFRPAASPMVTPIWHEGKADVGNWPVDRVLTSMHVYIALAVFADQARDRTFMRRHGTEDMDRERRRCVARANWLHDTAVAHDHLLSQSGKAFVAFNRRLIDGLTDPEGDRHVDVY